MTNIVVVYRHVFIVSARGYSFPTLRRSTTVRRLISSRATFRNDVTDDITDDVSERVQQRVDGGVDGQEDDSRPGVGGVRDDQAVLGHQTHDTDGEPAQEVCGDDQGQLTCHGHVSLVPELGLAFAEAHMFRVDPHRSVDGRLADRYQEEQD